MSEQHSNGGTPPSSAESVDSVINKIALRRREMQARVPHAGAVTAATPPAAASPPEAASPSALERTMVTPVSTEYERAAAVLAWFDANTIKPLSGERDPRLVDLLLTR